MKLSELLKGIVSLVGFKDPEIRGVTQDSRSVEPGFLFVAVPGVQQDGRKFIPEAVQRGAAGLIVSTGKPLVDLPIPQLQVENPREVLSLIAARFYEEPSRFLRLFGVTGTNGKTTLTYLMESMLRAEGRTPGVIGTVNYRYKGVVKEAATTTPEAVSLQQFLAEMRTAGVTDVVMEVSSHALAQGRVMGVHFDGAAFTNLSRDHLDYHLDLEEYFKAKQSFFNVVLPASLKREKFAVINTEDPHGLRLVPSCPERVIRVGSSPGCEVRAASIRLTAEGIRAGIQWHGSSHEVFSPLIGRFNLENLLVAIGLGVGAGLSDEAILKGIRAMTSVPGRLEKIPNTHGIQVYVDYAHTPQALSGVLTALRPLCKRKLIVVFGCGGDRDSGKRAEMGREVAKQADVIVVTSDNPRSEDPEKIIDQILTGIQKGSQEVVRLADRREAISKTLQMAQRGDLVVIAGKGHENYQILGARKVPFSDQEVVRELLH